MRHTVSSIALSLAALSLAVLALVSGCALISTDNSYDAVVLEAACGQCQFALQGESCDLALRDGEQAWFVDGTLIDDHGDAHADDGFCNAVRQARVSGHVEGDRFVVTDFELLPDDEG